MRTIWLALGAMAACGGNSGGGNGSCPPFAQTCVGGGGNGTVDAQTQSIQFQSFPAHTRSLGLAQGEFQLSITDGTGTIACELSVDQANSLGGAGSEIIAHVAYAAGEPCPVGNYSVPSACPAMDSTHLSYVPEHCAYYRAWDAHGNALGSVAATAGAITISGDQNTCTIGVNLSFAGQSFTDSFTLVNGLDAQPWCASN